MQLEPKLYVSEDLISVTLLNILKCVSTHTLFRTSLDTWKNFKQPFHMFAHRVILYLIVLTCVQSLPKEQIR